MFATAVIVFREVLEIAIILGIVLAATRGLSGRGRWISVGISVGLVGAVMVAGFAQAITSALSGMGQEIFSAAVLLAAVLMLVWHNIWMSRHGRALSREMNALGRAVATGRQSVYTLSIVIGLAVLREGSELVLFLSGVATGQPDTHRTMLTGGLLGLALGGSAGSLLYFGLLRLSGRHLFAITSLLITFFAAGMAAQAAGFLEQAGLLPPIVSVLWDTSGWVSRHSLAGHALNVLLGYLDRPSAIQLLFYIVTLAFMWGFTQVNRNSRQQAALEV